MARENGQKYELNELEIIESLSLPCLLVSDKRGFPILGCNRAYENFFAIKRQHVQTQHLLKAAGWAKSQGLATKLRGLRGRKDYQAEQLFITPKGDSDQQWLLSLSRWPAQHNRPAFLICIQDLSKEHKLRRRCRELELKRHRAELFEALVENSSDFIGIADSDRVPMFVNAAGRKMVGLGRNKDIRHTRIPDYYTDEELAKVKQKILPQLAETGYWRGETWLRHWESGERIPVIDEQFAIRDPQGKHILAYGSITRDISDLMAERERLKLEREQLNSAQAVARIGSWELDLVTNHLWWSDEAYRIFDIDKSRFEASYEGFVDRVHPDDRAIVDKAYSDAVANQTPYSIDHRLLLADGSVRHVHEQCETIYNDDGKPVRSIGTVQDITDRMQAELAMRQASIVLEAANDAIIMTDSKGHVISVNPAFSRITGFEASEVIGQNPRIWNSGRHDADFYQDMWEQILSAGYWGGELWNRRKNGEIYPVWENITAVRDQRGEISHFVSIFSDISVIKDAESKLEYQAKHDALTGLPNRSLFASNLDLAIAYARRHKKMAAVILLDLDRFKLINDTLGHATGDQILLEVGKRLRKSAREEDTVARLGGDEFALIINELASPEDAAKIARKIIDLLAKPVSIQNKKLVSSSSIGIGLFPNDAKTGADLVRAADTAMYRAKARGRNTFSFYTADLSNQAAQHLNIENDLRRALKHNELKLQYQPLSQISDGRIVGVEALLRWQHPTRGVIMPDSFIRIAEESGLIEPIGEWVLNHALDQVVSWSRQGINVGRMSINVSGRQVLYEHVADTVATALERHQDLPEGASLELEITENVLLSSERSSAVFERLKACGANIAIDDFGTGYSSLSRLQHLPVDTLKIDRSFLRGVPQSKENAAIVTAIISMAKNLGLRVIAEGVENQQQLDFLKRHGCDEAQGYFVGRPLNVEQVASMIGQRNAYELF